ncbi:MAG TPA: hypothetical protein VF469_05285 [Kofleriaceae bacterium]
MLDTDKSGLCLTNQPASWTAALQPDACFVVGDTVIVASLKATGSRPLVIVARSQINVMGLLDVASHRMSGTEGAGSQPTDCKPFGRNPGNGQPNGGGGGGAGGSFMFPGADGGTGDGVNHQGGQAPSSDVGAPTRLRGGCPGQPGNGGKPNDAGAGGGAVYLVSAGEISISGKINASGAGGGGGDATDGGGGGGSGGTIVLYGSPVTTMATTVLLANGGGGGGGGSTGPAKGVNGVDPGFGVPITAALGGGGGILNGGTGGDGGSGYAQSSNAGTGTSGDTGAGGGGGGGGGGYIQSNQDLAPAVLSPATTIRP